LTVCNITEIVAPSRIDVAIRWLAEHSSYSWATCD